MPTVTLNNHQVELSNLDKVFYPDEGITKGDVVEYYQRIAERMLPHLRERPVTMQRFPDGIRNEGFYQKEISDYFPGWIRRVTVSKENGEVTHVVCDDAATLVYLANQACLTPHVWLSRRDKVHHPDQLIFDLDPAGDDFEPVRAAARALHELLDELQLEAFCKTTGSRGLHVLVPVDRDANFDAARRFARDVAELLAARESDRFTTEPRKEKRRGRLFLDYLRNSYAQTAVAAYALRAKPGAPVATPIDWHELDNSDLGPRRYTLRNLFQRLGQKEDPWRDLPGAGQSLTRARETLDKLRDEADLRE